MWGRTRCGWGASRTAGAGAGAGAAMGAGDHRRRGAARRRRPTGRIRGRVGDGRRRPIGCRYLRRPDTAPARLGPRHPHRRSGGARLRAPLPGVGHGLDDRPRVPGGVPLPVGCLVLRRGGPVPGGRGRRGGGQHPPVRCPPGQRRVGPPRAPGGGLRRVPRARGGDDGQPGGGDRARPVPGAGGRGPVGGGHRTPGGGNHGRPGGRPRGSAAAGAPTAGRPTGPPGPPSPGRVAAVVAARTPALVAAVARSWWRRDVGSGRSRGRRRRTGHRGGGRTGQRPARSPDGVAASGSGGRRRTTSPARNGPGGIASLQAAGHLAEDLGRLLALGDDDVAWVDDGQRSPSLRVSPIDVGPVLSERLWGAVTAVLTSATVPIGLVERLGLPEEETDRARRGKPLRLPGARPALRGQVHPGPATTRVGAGHPRRARDPASTPPAVARWPCSPAGGPCPRPARRSAPACPSPPHPVRSAQAGTGRGLPVDGVDLPLRHARVLAGHRRPRSTLPWSPSTGSPSRGPTTRSSRRVGNGRAHRRSASWTSPGPGRCWPRGPAG